LSDQSLPPPPSFGVIWDASSTLQTVLNKALGTLTPAATAEVSDLQGTISTSSARITIFLYEVGEDPMSKNRPRVRTSVPPNITISKPPMALLLRYMLTPWSPDRTSDQTMLGLVMQVLYDGAILSGAVLQGSLANSDQALKVTLSPITLDDRTRVWYSIQKPYRLSLTYEVRVVNLKSEISTTSRPVSSRSVDANVPAATP
jgi:Pvc16 N-terminal domain